MKPRTKALVAAGSGIAVGVAGLALTSLPAGASDAPKLPAVDAEELVASTLESRPPAFEGVAEMQNELGLSAVPGMGALDFESARVFHDGAQSARVQVEQDSSELTFVQNPDEAWTYDSQEHAAQRLSWDKADADAARDQAGTRTTEPSEAATEILEQLRPTSDIAVDGTARVAGRGAYELVLTPKASEKTLLREVTVAIDEQTRVPLRFEVFANGSSDPVLSLGFTEFETGAQDAELFEFTPPEGAEVETLAADDVADRAAKHATGRADDGLEQHVTTVGDGWDTVVLAENPAGSVDGPHDRATAQGQDMEGLLGQFGAPVSGEFGSGTYVEVAVGGAVLADDGRIAAGAVPQQVLVDALEQDQE